MFMVANGLSEAQRERETHKFPVSTGNGNLSSIREGQKFDVPSISLGTLVEYIPMTAKDRSRLHPFAQKRLKIIILGYVPRKVGQESL